MTVILATNNAGKARELRAFFSHLPASAPCAAADRCAKNPSRWQCGLSGKSSPLTWVPNRAARDDAQSFAENLPAFPHIGGDFSGGFSDVEGSEVISNRSTDFNSNGICINRGCAEYMPIKVISLADLGLEFTAGEDMGTFEGNARQKAMETAEFLLEELTRGGRSPDGAREGERILRERLCIFARSANRHPSERRTSLDNLANTPSEASAMQGDVPPRTGDFAVLADDSGLVVDALGGAPGVDSALYLGQGTSFEVRNAHILEQLSGVPDEGRTARFVCVAACVVQGGEVLTATGVLEGRIARECAGAGGFGYDPIFVPAGRDKTLAQLDISEKNKISHRGQAMRAMEKLLRRAAGAL